MASETRSPLVLVLDDDPRIRRTAKRVLELYDYEVATAASAHEALAFLKEDSRPVDLLLCDLVLPGLGGREAANVLRGHAPDMKVLYMSGFATHDSHRRQLEESGDPFLSKPFEVDVLIDAVKKALAPSDPLHP